MRRFVKLLSLLALAINSSAQFAEPVLITPISKQVIDAEPGDFDGDGDLDVLASSEMDGKIVWYENDGSGEFPNHHVIIQTSRKERHLTVGDFNDDGYPDFVTGQHIDGDSNCKVYLNDGTGQFNVTDLSPLLGTIRIKLLYATDLNGDSLTDILVVYNGAWWYENLGNGNFGMAVEIESPVNGTFECFYDLNGDEALDGFIHYSNTFYYLLNDGSGQFAVHDTLEFELEDNLHGVEDLDGDGDKDILVEGYVVGASSNLKWLENLGNLEFSAHTILPTSNSIPFIIQIVDFDSNPGSDILMQYNGGTHRHHGFGSNVLVDSVCIGGGWLDTYFYEDFDGDEEKDLLLDQSLSIVRNTGDSIAWNDWNVMNTIGGTADFELVDIDKDGFRDIVSENRIDRATIKTLRYLGNNQYEITADPVEYRSLSYVDLHCHDLNYDGSPDIGYTSWYSGKFSHILNDGLGNFGNTEVLFDNGAVGSCWASGCQDFDGDGDYDVIHVPSEWGDNHIMFFRNQGGGNYDFEQIAPCIYGGNIGKSEAFDLENDGDMDLAFIPNESAGSGVVILVNDGTGHFEITHLQDVDNNSFSTPQITWADFDQDGDNDIAVNSTWTPRGIIVYEFDEGNFIRHFISTESVGPYKTQAMDVDNDGLADLVYTTSGMDYNDGGIYWFKNLGNWQFSAPYHSLYTGPFLYGVADLEIYDHDHDGDEDLFLSEGGFDGSGGIFYFENLFWGSYRIQGQTFYDEDEDGSFGPGDLEFPYVGIHVDPTQSAFFTNSSGEYNALTSTGWYTVSPSYDSGLWQLSSDSSSYTIEMGPNNSLYENMDFGFVANGFQPNAQVELVVPGGPCNVTGAMWMTVQNTGNTVLSGVVSVALDPLLTFNYSNPAPDSVVGNSLYYTIDSLYYYQLRQHFISVEMPNETSIGSSMNSSAEYVDVSGFVVSVPSGSILSCAYDPNDKMERNGEGPLGYVSDGEWLEYTIRFQNTGNAPATDVIIRDQLDEHLDWGTLVPISWSHDPEISIEPDGDAVFKFLNIMLVDSGSSFTESQGFFRYKIKPISNLYPGTEIHNTARILFDANPPIVTNTTLNTIECYQPTDQFIEWDYPELVSPFEQPISQQWFRNDSILAGETGIIHEPEYNGIYHVEALYPYNCKIESEQFNYNGVGIMNNEGIKGQIYPVPAQSELVVELTGKPPLGSSILITDVQGRLVKESSIDSQRMVLSVDDVKQGLYFAHLVTSGGQSLLGKVVINR